MTARTPGSSSACPPGSTSLYFTALFSIRSTLVPSSSLLRIASFRSASIRSLRLAMEAPSLERLALLLHRALLGRQRLLLPLHGGLLVVLPLADLRQDAGLLGRLLEALESALDRLAFLHSDTRHARGHLPPSNLDSGPLHGRCRRRTQGPACDADSAPLARDHPLHR